MRTLLTFTIPVAKGNQAITDGTLQQLLQNMQNTLHPEAAYFYPREGKRSGFFVFDMTDPSQIPVVAEPLFMELEAEVQLFPVMNPEDVMKGIAAAGFPGN